jgi:hypothetical protein
MDLSTSLFWMDLSCVEDLHEAKHLGADLLMSHPAT